MGENRKRTLDVTQGAVAGAKMDAGLLRRFNVARR
jgi:hypothetical protein